LIKSFGKHSKINITSQILDNQALLDAINQTMPFGKYAGRKLLHLPEPYLVWFSNKGFPEGKLGQQLALMHEVKVNGLESMLAPLLRDDE
ncbi:MAG: hypothetical protein ACI936_000058, partial [Paraglaciecola sp.]